MPRGIFNPKNASDPVQEIRDAVGNYIIRRFPGIEASYCEQNSKGLFIAVEDASESRGRLQLLDIDGRHSNEPVGETAPLSVGDLQNYIFDPEAEVPANQVIFDGLISRGDLVTWLGREKHRKSNLILQFAVCAAIGRDFLGFKYAAEESK